ncbi:glycerol kinase GlpK [Nocardioides terrisoli]|uniref:glycerol kinase GlpK n=1 Tax=Nocardioides terrisoli TaxID=3388267 RepID=UPI00287B8DA8|nr:glycerol kinase GlpK [Nocardioides marmorisolisilvae]
MTDATTKGILAIDAGTTGVTALVVTAEGTIAARGYQEFAQHFPQPGWVEHSPEEIWQATLESIRACLKAWGGDESGLAGIGITDQRETIVLWDRETLGSPRRAIVWQDRRTAEICSRLRDEGHEDRVAALTGLRLDPYFSATKLVWLAENEPHTWALVESGRYAVGTVDSYLVARMTRGTWHVTDVSNASRTLLFDLEQGDWSEELCSLFGVPRDALPDVVPSWGELATTDPRSFLGLELPVAGIAGDQQAALFGQTCFTEGESKCTYGTGSFILTNTGSTVQRSDAGLLSTAGWRTPDGTTTYALEGAIFVTGAAVQWLRDGLQIVGSAAETEAIARTVPSSDGVVFVPALTGLGAPHWDPHARGTIFGITRGTTRAHLVRATLEAITYEVRDVIDTMPGLRSLAVDGGAAANDLLCQLQADLLGVPVERPRIVETTALGAAFMAGLGTGVWDSTEDLRETWQLDRRFEPDSANAATAADGHRRWQDAVRRSTGWAIPLSEGHDGA